MMTFRQAQTSKRSGFSLVELLTAVAIIAVLIGILVPALGKARDHSKRTQTLSLLSAIDRGLEMFAADFGRYPDSSNPSGKSERTDPIIEWADIDGDGIPPVDDARLSGAHWLARALAGHDFKGVDAAGKVVGNGRHETVTYNSLLSDRDPVTGMPGIHSVRKGPYLEGEMFARDNDTEKFPGTAGQSANFTFEPKERMMVYDASFGSPVLYYRANSKAHNPFCRTGRGQGRMGAKSGDFLGIYCHQDNAWIAGDDWTGDWGWDFAGTGQKQGLYEFGVLVGEREVSEGSFMAYMQNHSAPGNLITPHNPDRFILITAGKDGLFGTEDDINNFEFGS